MSSKVARRTGRWVLAAVALLCPAAGAAVEFTAQMVVREGPKMATGKISVKNGRMRHEFLDEEGQSITIVRPDKKVIWVIIPREQSYLEIPYMKRLPGQFLQIPPDAISKRQVGTETVNGYPTDKYEVTLRGGKAGVIRQTFWVAPKLETPIKMSRAGGSLVAEYRNIKEGPLADKLFELPPGYKKLSKPTGYSLEPRL